MREEALFRGNVLYKKVNAAFIVSFLLLKTSLKIAFISIIASLLLLFPIVMRLSRNIYINMFISFDADAAKKFQNV